MVNFLFKRVIPHFEENLNRKHWLPQDHIRKAKAILKAKKMIADNQLKVTKMENLNVFEVVQDADQKSTHLVNTETGNCDCAAFLMTGKICYHKAAVEQYLKGIKKKKKKINNIFSNFFDFSIF
jgi:hypothetical protein